MLLTTENALAEAHGVLDDHSELVTIQSLGSSVKTLNQKAYSEMLKKEEFWQGLEAEKLLIFQTDSLLLEPLPDAFFEFSYVGAPFAMGRHISHRFPVYTDTGERMPDEYEATLCGNNTLRKQLPLGYGNGGLSIRRRSAMISICKNFPSDSGEPEDLYFSRHIESLEGGIAAFTDASRFSSEQSYSDSIGIHSSWLYLDVSQQSQLYDKHLRQLIAISRAAES